MSDISVSMAQEILTLARAVREANSTDGRGYQVTNVHTRVRLEDTLNRAVEDYRNWKGYGK